MWEWFSSKKLARHQKFNIVMLITFILALLKIIDDYFDK